MLQVCADFRAEVDDVHAFLATLAPAMWTRETAFMQWTPWDVVAHLHFFNLVSLVSLRGEAAFAPERKALFAQISSGRTNRELARERFAALEAPSALLAAWREGSHELAHALGAAEPKLRLPWFGPSMGVQMFTTARLMETWAHAQEVYDLAGAARVPSDRIRHIATIGVRTFGWTFKNRRQEPPGPAPYVKLKAPSGAVWEWNAPSESDFVRGAALDFCHVVTQGRNVADTALEVQGVVATRWMAIAQCFAGAPVDPPPPGARGAAA